MENFKLIIKKRISTMALYTLVFVLILASGLIHKTVGPNEHIRDFMSGTLFGVIVVSEFAIVYSIFKYTSALKSDEKLKFLYIEEHDERNIMIENKIGGVGLNLVILMLGLATIIASFISTTIYFTLGIALCGVLIIKACLKLYYNKNM